MVLVIVYASKEEQPASMEQLLSYFLTTAFIIYMAVSATFMVIILGLANALQCCTHVPL
jgi:hypothetical protein